MWKVHTTNGSNADSKGPWGSHSALARRSTRSEELSNTLGHREGTSIGTDASSGNEERKDVGNHVDIVWSINDKVEASEGVAKKRSVRSIVIKLCYGRGWRCRMERER